MFQFSFPFLLPFLLQSFFAQPLNSLHQHHNNFSNNFNHSCLPLFVARDKWCSLCLRQKYWKRKFRSIFFCVVSFLLRMCGGFLLWMTSLSECWNSNVFFRHWQLLDVFSLYFLMICKIFNNWILAYDLCQFYFCEGFCDELFSLRIFV